MCYTDFEVIDLQINRLFEIIYILLEKKTVTASELANRFEVSVRTIYRDVETLSSAGVPIYMARGKGGGISLLSGYVLNKTVLTDEEKTEIVSSMKAFNLLGNTERSSALGKLSGLFGDNNTDWIEIDFSSWSGGIEENQKFNILKQSVIEKKIIKFTYSNGKGEQSVREVEPLKLCFKGQEWYIYAYCKAKLDYRFFKIKRLSNLETTETSFERKSPEKIFSENTKYKKNEVKIKIKISKQLAFRVYDEFAKFEKCDDGNFLVEVVLEKNWAYSYISTFGKYAEVIEPLEVRESYRKSLEENIKLYL